MSKILDFFDDAYYINLDERTDRKEKIENQLSKLNIQAKRFPGIKFGVDDLPIPLYEKFYIKQDLNLNDKKKMLANMGCSESHRAIIKEAKEKKLNNVLIFEDDCLFLDSWKTEINKVINDLKQIKKWDMFFFGGCLDTHTEKITENIIKFDGVWGLHAYAVNSSFYDKALSVNIHDSDPQYTSYISDLFYYHYDKNNKIYLGPKNIMAVQEEGWSDVQIDYKNQDIQSCYQRSWQDTVRNL